MTAWQGVVSSASPLFSVEDQAVLLPPPIRPSVPASSSISYEDYVQRSIVQWSVVEELRVKVHDQPRLLRGVSFGRSTELSTRRERRIREPPSNLGISSNFHHLPHTTTKRTSGSPRTTTRIAGEKKIIFSRLYSSFSFARLPSCLRLIAAFSGRR